jgi:hypothetical protein
VKRHRLDWRLTQTPYNPTLNTQRPTSNSDSSALDVARWALGVSVVFQLAQTHLYARRNLLRKTSIVSCTSPAQIRLRQRRALIASLGQRPRNDETEKATSAEGAIHFRRQFDTADFRQPNLKQMR